MWRDAGTPDPVFTDTLELDLGDVEPSLAGPKRPQDRVPLSQGVGFRQGSEDDFGDRRSAACPSTAPTTRWRTATW